MRISQETSGLRAISRGGEQRLPISGEGEQRDTLTLGPPAWTRAIPPVVGAGLGVAAAVLALHNAPVAIKVVHGALFGSVGCAFGALVSCGMTSDNNGPPSRRKVTDPPPRPSVSLAPHKEAPARPQVATVALREEGDYPPKEYNWQNVKIDRNANGTKTYAWNNTRIERNSDGTRTYDWSGQRIQRDSKGRKMYNWQGIRIDYRD